MSTVAPSSAASTPGPQPARRRPAGWKWLLPPALCLLLVLGLVAGRIAAWQDPGSAIAYHQRVAAAMERIPYQVGSFTGKDAPVPQAAVRLLKPNSIVSRQYRDVSDGRAVALLLVQCRDARDLLGHFPPVCYKGQGWTLQRQEDRTWREGGRSYPGTVYHFERTRAQGQESVQVANFMLTASGRVLPDMDQLRDYAASRRRRVWGAGQFQLVADGGWPAAEFEAAVKQYLASTQEALTTILTGTHHE